VTLLASDVVAASKFVSGDLALRTGLNVFSSYKLSELSVANVCAADPPVVNCTAAHADLLPTCADCFLFKPVCTSNVIHAPISRTPAQIGIQVDVDVHLESNILLKYLFAAECLDVVFEELLVTPVLHARNLNYLPVDDVCLQVV
jgi:hypothetical protein